VASVEVTRHFTATTFVVHRGKALLHFHKSLSMWLPPGGHIDRDELPHECAVREVQEETGLNVRILLENPARAGDIDTVGVEVLPSPRYILLEDINEFHQHIDFIYFALADTFDLAPGEGESMEMRLMDPNDIGADPELTPDIKVLAREAILAARERSNRL